MKLTSAAFLRSVREGEPCAALDWLEEWSEGVLCLTGGYDGPVDRLLRAERPQEAQDLLAKLQALFPDRLYIELQRHDLRDTSEVEVALTDFA